MLVDTHSHIYLEHFNDDRQVVIDNALANGVHKILLPNIDSSSVLAMLDAKNERPDVFEMALGLHPTSVNDKYEIELENIFNYFDKSRFVAIGEIGIDLYWDKTFYEQQKIALDYQLEFALKQNLPVIIHSRNSFDEIIDIVKPFVPRGIRGVFHCFPGDVDQAKKVVDMGFYLGIGGVVTYKKSDMMEVVKNIPLESILLETDSPYLSPVPKRGKRNEPAYVKYVADKISELTGRDIDEVSEISTVNAKELFNL